MRFHFGDARIFGGGQPWEILFRGRCRPRRLILRRLRHSDISSAILRASPGHALAAIRQELAGDEVGTNLNPKWLGESYTTLQGAAAETSGSAVVDESRPRPGRTLDETSSHTEVLGENDRIGIAFREVFVPGTPPDLLDIGLYFHKAERVSEAIAQMLLQHPSVIHGGAVAERLIPYRMTPASLFGACVSIGNAVRRIQRMDKGGQRLPLPREPVVQALRYVTQMPQTTASRLVDWIVGLGLRCTPHIIPGFALIERQGQVIAAFREERRKDAEFLWRSEFPMDRDAPH